jgi:signal transduction histidine kinase
MLLVPRAIDRHDRKMSRVSRHRRRIGRYAASIALSCGITALMCFLFNGTVRLDFMLTGLVCAIVVSAGIERMARRHRIQLARAHAELEDRVAERTAQLALANHELMIRDRMATAGTLAAGVSHEIRTPLSVIMMAVEEVRDAGELPGDAGVILADVAEAAAQIAVILRDLSSLASPVEEPLGAVPLAPVIDGAVRLAAYQMRGRSRLERGPCDVPPVVGTSARLVQVVLNLLANAARAGRSDADNLVRISAELRDGEVALAVCDTGVGMDEETRARLFEPFYTTGRDRGGTGLGLAICRSIVDAAGGRIEVDSTLGIGTTMTVFLQVAAPDRARKPAAFAYAIPA